MLFLFLKLNINMIMYIFFLKKNPASQLIILLFLSLNISFIFSYFLKNSWIMLMFMLAMISGMLILFAYMTSLMSLFSMKNNNYFKFLPPFLIIFFLENNLIFKISSNKFWIANFFFSNKNFWLLISISYILISLFLIIEIINNSKSTLRKK
uniref:NADH dehydrogenase subunit 6 n=1 Tax=Macrocheles nataliae TaxID=2058476 RepID=A0A6B9WGA9_9ACAR|nr:NADH dehydrogenase subunit 6 [Macrocheles nataliae]